MRRCPQKIHFGKDEWSQYPEKRVYSGSKHTLFERGALCRLCPWPTVARLGFVLSIFFSDSSASCWAMSFPTMKAFLSTPPIRYGTTTKGLSGGYCRTELPEPAPFCLVPCSSPTTCASATRSCTESSGEFIS